MDEQALRQRIRKILLQQAAEKGQAVGRGISAGGVSAGGRRKVKKGGDWNSFWNTVQHPDQWAPAIAHEVTDPNSDLRAKIIPAGQKIAEVVSGLGYSGGGQHKASAKTRKPNKHAQAVKSYMAKHKGCTLAEASRAVSRK